MREIKFRPLRRIKKSGKITVASYMGWRKVMTADYGKFNLAVNDEYKMFPKDEYVYNHEGQLLYFFNYNPADVPVFNYSLMMDLEKIQSAHPHSHGIRWSETGHVNYNMRGMDSDGVPTFSHWDEERVTQEDVWNYYGHDQFEPLTVGTVLKWFGWFLYQLENSYLKIGNP